MGRWAHLSEGIDSAFVRNVALGESYGVPIFGQPGHLTWGQEGVMTETWWKYVLPLSPFQLLVDDWETYQDAAKTVPAGPGDALYTWGDLSGNGNDAVQATAARRPQVTAAGVDFDAPNSEWMSLGALAPVSNDYTLIQVIVPDDATAIQSMMGTGGSVGFVFSHLAGMFSGINDGAAWLDIAPATARAQCIAWRVAAGTTLAEVFRDGLKIGEDNTYDGTWAWATPALGARAGGGSQYYNGLLRCSLLWDSALSDAALALAMSAAMHRYAIVATYQTVADVTYAFLSDRNLTGDPVSAWGDELGGAADFTGVVGERPDRADIDTTRGITSLDYDGIDDNLVTSVAADWTLLHDGSGSTCLMVARALDLSLGTQALFESWPSPLLTEVGVSLLFQPTGNLVWRASNGGGASYTWDASGGAGTIVEDQTQRILMRTATGAASEYDCRVDGVSVMSGGFLAAPAVGASTGSLRVGARQGGSLTGRFRCGDMVVANRYVNDFEAAALETIAAWRFAA